MSRSARASALGSLVLGFLCIPLSLSHLPSSALLGPTPVQAQQPAGSAEKEAFEASKALGTVEAWDAFLRNYPNGFHADLARAYLRKLADTPAPGAPRSAGPSAPPAPQPQAATSDTVSLAATQILVGKWPERAAFDGRSLWVSESGTRSIVEIDLQSRRTGRRHRVGRLPVDMVATENGTVYALAETDNMIYALSGGGSSAGEFADVPRCADIMAYAANTLFVVSNLNCSAPAVLTRVSHLNGRTSKIADVAAGPTDMKAAHGHVYIGHMGSGARRGFVTVFNATSGDGWAPPDLAIHYPRLAVNSSAVFIGGAPLDSQTGIVTKLGAAQHQFVGEQRLPEAIVALAATDQYVVAAGRQGSLFVLAASDLSLVRTIRTGAAMEPHDILALGNTLAVVSSRGNDVAADNAVYLIDGWLPGGAAVAPFVPPPVYRAPAAEELPPRAAPVVEKKRPEKLRCGEGYKKVRGECVLLQNCGPNAYRSPEGDCYCNKNYMMKNGRCIWKHDKNGFEVAPWKKPGCSTWQQECKQGSNSACGKYEANCQVN